MLSSPTPARAKTMAPGIIPIAVAAMNGPSRTPAKAAPAPGAENPREIRGPAGLRADRRAQQRVAERRAGREKDERGADRGTDHRGRSTEHKPEEKAPGDGQKYGSRHRECDGDNIKSHVGENGQQPVG